MKWGFQILSYLFIQLEIFSIDFKKTQGKTRQKQKQNGLVWIGNHPLAKHQHVERRQEHQSLMILAGRGPGLQRDLTQYSPFHGSHLEVFCCCCCYSHASKESLLTWFFSHIPTELTLRGVCHQPYFFYIFFLKKILSFIFITRKRKGRGEW